MGELVDFSEKLSACDFIAFTTVGEERMYCRFYANGLYIDRMFVTNMNLLEELMQLSKDREVIEENCVLRLKVKYSTIAKDTEDESSPRSAAV